MGRFFLACDVTDGNLFTMENIAYCNTRGVILQGFPNKENLEPDDSIVAVIGPNGTLSNDFLERCELFSPPIPIIIAARESNLRVAALPTHIATPVVFDPGATYIMRLITVAKAVVSHADHRPLTPGRHFFSQREGTIKPVEMEEVEAVSGV